MLAFHSWAICPPSDEHDQIKRFKVGRVVQKVDNAIHRINHYTTASVVSFVNTYPMDSGLSRSVIQPLNNKGPNVERLSRR